MLTYCSSSARYWIELTEICVGTPRAPYFTVSWCDLASIACWMTRCSRGTVARSFATALDFFVGAPPRTLMTFQELIGQKQVRRTS